MLNTVYFMSVLNEGMIVMCEMIVMCDVGAMYMYNTINFLFL